MQVNTRKSYLVKKVREVFLDKITHGLVWDEKELVVKCFKEKTSKHVHKRSEAGRVNNLVKEQYVSRLWLIVVTVQK